MTATAYAPARRSWITSPRDFVLFLLVFLAISLVISGAAFLLWTANPAQPLNVAFAALQDSPSVTVTEANGVITWMPASPDRDLGVLFYPGALVDPRAYAPILRPLAEAGYVVVTTAMPLNLAIFDIDAADRLRAAHPEIARWAIAGHSMGGAMASRYALDSGDLAGLALLASFPFGSLADSDLPVISIYGDQDGLLPISQIDSSRADLPAGARFELIAGANHAQFGDYGDQARDLPARIPAAQQQAEIVRLLLDWLAGL
jgi:pimeloyl-ACP methyl ester carboxylesterase